MRPLCSNKLLCTALLIFLIAHTTIAESRQLRTPARILAKQTGATQFEEERYEAHKDCDEHKHHLKKRASDEDVDYEVYQGVVGRPGIDFPIYPRIPRTTFSCRSFGNGYFADMDTDCQVFHICEEGRKISFLCPNGTIFQQSELTCDWWFKVNCLGSPGYYAESAEILNKQRLHRVRPSVPVQGFNIVGGGLNIKPKINNVQTRPRNTNKSERRIDSSEQQPSVENVDFEDLSGEKQLKGQSHKEISDIEHNSNDESQIPAETASFVTGRGRNSYTYQKPGESRNKVVGVVQQGRPGNSGKAFSNPPSTNTEPNERFRNGQRGQQRFQEDKKPLAESFEKSASNEDKENKKLKIPEKLVQSVTSKPKIDTTTVPDVKPEYYDSPKRTTERTQTTTHQHSQGTYSTARKLDITRTTPFYTPTVPSVQKAKTTVGKSHYVKGTDSSGFIATTPNPNRLNGHGNSASGSNFFLESSTPKPFSSTTETTANVKETTIGTTFRPFIIGMRHNHEGDPSSIESYRFPLSSTKPFQFDGMKPEKKFEARDYLPTTTTPATTGPTYLPKSAVTPKGSADAAGDDLLLFAPSLTAGESVSRNVDEMLKTIGMLKTELSDAEEIKGTGPARMGLEIPPSSGPDVLISLAKYFATEPSSASPNLVTETDKKKTSEKVSKSAHSLGSKPSDTTATITTAATPRIAAKADDIKTSLLSERTVDRYTSLFGLNSSIQGRQADDISTGLARNVNETNTPKSKEVYGIFPPISSTDTTIRELAEKPESRTIAQVFSNALSTYLEDPKTFRQQLESIRPTEPPSYSVSTITPNFTPVTATDSALFKSGTAATYLPTKPPSPIKLSPTTTAQPSIAAEINDKFDVSTQFPESTSTTEQFDTTTYRPPHGSFQQKHNLELSAELAPPSPESGEGEEFLHRGETQSFVKSRNELPSSEGATKKVGKATGSYISAAKPTENPWNGVSQTDFLDPLTINDGLMKETQTTTASPFIYKSKETTTQQYPTTHSNAQYRLVPSSASQARNTGSRFGFTSGEATTQRNVNQESDSWHDILNSYDLPVETLPSSNGLQRIANRLFGGLNESEALHLKNVMQQAEHNRQVLRLLLLLIQTCDDQNGKALERSRKHLLNALIDMDEKLQKEHKSKTAHVKGGRTAAAGITTTRAPTTTLLYHTTTTDLPATSTTVSGSLEETTKFEIRVEDPEEDQISTASTISATNSNSSSDRRALELLKSLYSLASKFTSRR